MVDLLEGQPTHVYQGRAAIKPSLNWRSKVQKRDEPEKGHPRVWLIGDAMHAMLPNRYESSFTPILFAHVLT